MSDRIKVVTHRGKQIFLQDFTNVSPGPEFDALIAEARKYLDSQPPKSVLSLFDGTGGHYNVEVLAALKAYAKANEAYMKASAVMGGEGILGIALMAVARFTGRSFTPFKDRLSAMDWLAEQ